MNLKEIIAEIAALALETAKISPQQTSDRRSKLADEITMMIAHDRGCCRHLLDGLDDLAKKAFACELLQDIKDSAILDACVQLATSHSDELQMFANIVLAKAGRSTIASDLQEIASGTFNLRRRYYSGVALLLLHEPDGLDVLSFVLEEELSYGIKFIAVDNDAVYRAQAFPEYSPRIVKIFQAICGSDVGDTPRTVVEWWRKNRLTVGDITTEKVPSYLLRYYSLF